MSSHPKFRDPYAMDARFHSGAGPHKHPKYEASKSECRKFDPRNLEEEETDELPAFWEEAKEEE
jgi:hypothetical protein